MTPPNENYLPLQCLYRWSSERASEIYLTQPLGAGQVRDFTWADASEEVRRMAAHLRSFNWEPGSRIGLLSKNSAWWFLAEYAIWMAGHVSVPVYPSLTGDSVRFILEHSEARALFIGRLDSEDWSAMTAGIPQGLHVIRMPLAQEGEVPGVAVAEWDEVCVSSRPLEGFPKRGADELATIVYTSGTTGTPKGVMHSFGNLGQAVGLFKPMYGCGPEDRLLSYLPLAHVADRNASQLASLGAGCRVFFNESVETFAADLQRAQPTFFVSVPRLWTKFRQAVNARISQAQLAAMLADPKMRDTVRQKVLAQMGLQNVRLALCGAAPLPPDLHQWYLDLGLELLEVYGMTENLGISHGSRPGRGRIGYVGQPQDGVEVKRSEIGEVLVRGPGQMLGYFKDPQRTAEALTDDGFLRTGDVGEIDAENYFRITGRAKEQFKTSKGKYVAPAPIENALASHPQIEASCVTGVGFSQPFALVMLSPAGTTLLATVDGGAKLGQSLNALREEINAKLDPHERLDFLAVVPDAWTVENDFVTPTFKVKRARIEKHYGERFESWAAQRQPLVWV